MRAAASTLLLAAVLLATLAGAQDKPKLPAWKLDPYTHGDPKLMKELGYVNFGPFPYGQKGAKGCTSEDVEKHLGYERILWVETAHFKIGSMLPEWSVPEEVETKAKLRKELEFLKKKLPKINPTTRVLDPWLRLHLVAYRMEEIYKSIQDLFAVTDANFPLDETKVITGQGEYMGHGPYLGMRKKYEILIFEKTSTFQDYLKNFVGRVTTFEQRWHFKETGSLWFGVPIDRGEGQLKHDTGLHQCLGHNLAHNLLDGFRHYSYDLPTWLTEGFAHWFERTIAPKWMSYCQNEASLAEMKNEYKFKSVARRLVETGKGTVFSEAFGWRDYSQVSWNDHVLLFARIDFLMSMGKDKFAVFLRKVKGRVDKNWLPNQENLVGACRDALQEVYSLSPLTFDDKFKAWVIKTYPVQEQ